MSLGVSSIDPSGDLDWLEPRAAAHGDRDCTGSRRPRCTAQARQRLSPGAGTPALRRPAQSVLVVIAPSVRFFGQPQRPISRG